MKFSIFIMIAKIVNRNLKKNVITLKSILIGGVIV